MNPQFYPLPIQTDLVFKEIDSELSTIASGILYIQLRDNRIGKFGIQHEPIPTTNGELSASPADSSQLLSKVHRFAFRQLVKKALEQKNGWTHGEIYFEFAVMDSCLRVDVRLESHYNMAHLLHLSKEKL